jgi:hypothetical protein
LKSLIPRASVAQAAESFPVNFMLRGAAAFGIVCKKSHLG